MKKIEKDYALKALKELQRDVLIRMDQEKNYSDQEVWKRLSERFAFYSEQIKAIEDDRKDLFGVDRNTLLLVAGNLAGVGLILFFERKDIITGKGLGFLRKL